MSSIRERSIFTAMNKAYTLTDRNVYDDMYKRLEFRIQTILADKSLTKNEKSVAIKNLNEQYDRINIRYNKGKRRICEVCKEECLATLYCEYCIRNYLKTKFSNWTSGNNDIDDLIKKCQMESRAPDMIVEWIPYNNFQNIEFLTRGGCADIYTADWIGSRYKNWNPEQQQLILSNTIRKVVLKKLENIESANRSWFDEAKSHLTITNKTSSIVQCYGLTQDQPNGNYMLVMKKLDINLREYIQQNHNKLTWRERIYIVTRVSYALRMIHVENAIHRDLHSGNILYSQHSNIWHISDLGFCGPADQPLGSIYGNLSYIAPEVIVGKGYTFASDIYSISMIMWEISSGQPPFTNYEKDYNLAMDIVNGMRPKVISGTPLKYKELMEQCWDADPTKRPNIKTFLSKINEINKLYYQIIPNDNTNIFSKFLEKIKKTNNLDKMSSFEIMSCYYASSKLSVSKIYQFDDLPEPRNATEEEQEAYHSKSYSFNIPENIDDFNISNNKNNDSTSTTNSIFRRNSKVLSKVFQKLHIGSDDNNQNSYQNNCERKIIKQQVKKQDIDDNDEIYNNPNLHPEEQDFEIPDGK
ncbi:polo kinase CDC5 [Rhizophagus irregularis DAOM 197198w]|uniref:Polo kinase CDC5 n=1 Tax=Rhizophagus irregularis (strain DAOM 197198w) TaxID=1432141 RepID=A0A015K887_RHIIW|nr:polo kinase CDC5 [Rhizophagus irregularis DAOM 197198w]